MSADSDGLTLLSCGRLDRVATRQLRFVQGVGLGVLVLCVVGLIGAFLRDKSAVIRFLQHSLSYYKNFGSHLLTSGHALLFK